MRTDTDRYVGSTTKYVCEREDRRFLHGNDTTILTCLQNGEWDQNITSCERKETFIEHSDYVNYAKD